MSRIRLVFAALALPLALAAQTPPCYADFPGPAYLTNWMISGGVILAIQLTSPNLLVITRMEVHTGNKTGASTMLVYAHDAVQNQPLNPPLGQGAFTEVAAIGWQGATLTTPVLIMPNTPFWFAWKPVGGELTPCEGYGTTLPGIQTYRPSFDNGQTWTGPYRQFQYKLRIGCGGQVFGAITAAGAGCKGSNQLVPALGWSGTPAVGVGYTVTLGSAAAALPAFLGLGVSTTTWSGIPLPFSLAALNAPGCSVYTDFTLVFGTSSNTAGAASILLQVPGIPALVGSVHHHQWAVLDAAANGLGLVTSGGARVVVGS